jgi:hypothetical protein
MHRPTCRPDPGPLGLPGTRATPIYQHAGVDRDPGMVDRWVMSKTACVLLVSGGPVRPADQGGELRAVSGGAPCLPGLAWSR